MSSYRTLLSLFIIFGNELIQVVDSISFKDSQHDNDEAKKVKRDMGARFKFLSTNLKHPLFRFYGVVCLLGLDFLEVFVELLFSESTVLTNKQDTSMAV